MWLWLWLGDALQLMVTSVNVPGLSMIRMVRLVRVFRLFKVSRSSIVVFARTMAMSSKPLFMLVFFTSIAMVVFSSLMCYAERGIYDEEMRMWCVSIISPHPSRPRSPAFVPSPWRLQACA
jgi:hypothetical protein